MGACKVYCFSKFSGAVWAKCKPDRDSSTLHFMPQNIKGPQGIGGPPLNLTEMLKTISSRVNTLFSWEQPDDISVISTYYVCSFYDMNVSTV